MAGAAAPATEGSFPIEASGLGQPVRAAGLAPAPGSPRRHAVTAYDHGDPTAEEQLMLELVNRARANPAAEAARLGLDLNEGLPPDTLSPEPKPPLAFNPHLLAAARAHSDWMLAFDVFSHDGADGSSPGDRVAAAGYVFSGSWSWGENIAWRGTTGEASVEQFTRDNHDNLFRSPGHRENLLAAGFDEVGIGVRSGQFTVETDQGPREFNAVMVTQNFARSGGTPGPWVVGVVYRDQNGDGFYTPGEGLAGVTVRPDRGEASAVTSTSGGYALPVQAHAGALTITFTGPGLAVFVARSVVVADVSVKVDLDVSRANDVPIVLERPGRDAQGRFTFELVGTPNARVRVETSADLRTWQSLSTYTLIGGRAAVTDPTRAPSPRFYRAVLVP